MQDVIVSEDIIIDEQFRFLLPALDRETYALLEENLLENGCRDPIVTWNGILIDGHNRYEICTRHGIPFDVASRDFDSREDVLIWIISTQVSRRNLTGIQLSYFRGLHYMADKVATKNPGGKNQYTELFHHNDGKPKVLSTARWLGEQYRVSSSTIERDAKVAEAIDAIGETSPDAKRKILSGEVSLSKKDLHKLSTGTPQDILEVAEKVEDGSLVRRQPARVAPEAVADEVHEPWDPGALDSVGSVNANIISFTDGLYSDLRWVASVTDAPGFKTAMRAYIDRLEDIYRRM